MGSKKLPKGLDEQWPKEKDIPEDSIWMKVFGKHELQFEFERPGLVTINATKDGVIAFVYEGTRVDSDDERSPIMHFDGPEKGLEWPGCGRLKGRAWVSRPGDKDMEDRDYVDYVADWVERHKQESVVKDFLWLLTRHSLVGVFEESRRYQHNLVLRERRVNREATRYWKKGMRETLLRIEECHGGPLGEKYLRKVILDFARTGRV